jgi:6-phospho-beta-glucosidase
MNHFGWVTGARWQGRDMMPELLDRIAQSPESRLPVETDIVLALGVIPTSYFQYIYHPDRLLEKQRHIPRARADELLELEAEILAAYQSGESERKPDSLARRNAAWYRHMVVPTLLAHACDTGEAQYLQVRNGSTLPFMPPQAIVETLCLVRRSGILPLAYDGGLPPDLEALLLGNAVTEMLWVEAIVERSYSKALRAMLMNPLVTHYDQARSILDKIWPDQEH